MASNTNTKLTNPEIRDKKCATCRHYEPSPLRRRGWCRNPLLYERHTNHLVEEDTLACSRGFGSVDYWEPLILRDGRTALTRREKQQAREASLNADLGMEDGQVPSQAATASLQEEPVVELIPSPPPAPTNGNRPAPTGYRIGTAPQPSVLRSSGSPLPSPNDTGRAKLRNRFNKRTPVAPVNPATPAAQVPVSFGRRLQIFLLARPWLPVLLILLLLAGIGGGMFVRNGGASNLNIHIGPLQIGAEATVTPQATATPIPTTVLLMMPTDTPVPAPPTVAVLPTQPPVPAVVPSTLTVGTYAQTTSGLNVRSTPSIKGTKLVTLNPGTVVRLAEGPTQAEGISWWKIDHVPGQDPNAVGWCSGQFLKPAAPPQQLEIRD